MFRFKYDYTDYGLLMRDLANQLGVPVNGNRIDLAGGVAEGYYYFLKLPNGIHTNIISVELQSDFLLYRNRREEEYYTLRFDQIEFSGPMAVTIDDAIIKEENVTRSVAYLTSSRFDWSMMVSKGTIINSVNALFSKEWLARYLGLKTVEECLGAYLAMKAFHFNTEPLDTEYTRLLREIRESNSEHPMHLAIVQNRMLLLIERFFTRLIRKMQQADGSLAISQDDINRMILVEQTLTHDLFRKPPTIVELARQHAISESKLKKDFKMVFGLPLYEYFQKARMQAARETLLTGNYSIKQIAINLGYSNMSNFSIAFKKEFGVLPSKMLSE